MTPNGRSPTMLPRTFWWVVVTAVLFLTMYFVKPTAAAGTMYKVQMFTFAVVSAYWADHFFFRRVSDKIEGIMPRDIFSASRVLSRAIIFLGACYVYSLGVY